MFAGREGAGGAGWSGKCGPSWVPSTGRCSASPPSHQAARLIRLAGIQGVRPGRGVRTTRPDTAAARHPDLVKRNFTATAPNKWWVTDLSHVSTWACVAYVCFIFHLCAA